jgi:hypothetical protein
MTASVPKRVFPRESLDSAGGSIYVNLLPIDRINEHEGTRLPGASVLWGGGKARDFLPGIASFPHLLTVFRGREEVTARAEVWGDGTIDREAALGVTRGCKPLPAPSRFS